ncbi:hypothetical protein [Rudaeicoccus suwonensis]|nr:hypothetical protein [Rudaeicoccus suwonensis]
MDDAPEEVEGSAWGKYSHQCPLCGMGVLHDTDWEPLLLSNMDDLLQALQLSNWDEFESWVSDFTDDHVEVEQGSSMEGSDGVRTCGGGFGQGFEFPGDLRELIADLQSAEDCARKDWESFTGEAARRLVPLSEISGW